MRYGWQRDFGDMRDFALPRATGLTPDRVNMKKWMPPVLNQGDLGSCTANAWSSAFQYTLIKQKAAHIFRPSRLQIYYDEREIQGTVNSDSGAQIRDGAKSINKKGVCPEWMWPYDENQFDVKPRVACYEEAKKHQSVSYWSVAQTQRDLEACLAAGYPLVFGFTVYESFESNETAGSGVVTMPHASEEIVGGHAVMLVGYDKVKRVWICRNSWGTGWGDNGYFYMPYEYLINGELADDFWTLRRVEV